MKTLQKQSAPVSQCGQTTTPDRYTDFFTREDIESSCRKISRKIKTVYETIVDGSAVFYHKSNLHVVPFDVVKIVSSIDVQNKLDKTIKNIIRIIAFAIRTKENLIKTRVFHGKTKETLIKQNTLNRKSKQNKRFA